MLLLQAHTGAVRSVAYSPDGKLLATGGDDTVVRLWDLATGRLRKKGPAPLAWVRALAFTPAGQRLAPAGWGDAVWVWGGRGWWGEPTLRRHAGGAWSLAWSPDDSALAVGAG